MPPADLVIHVIDDAAQTADAGQVEYQTEGNLVLRVRNKIDQSGRTAGYSVLERKHHRSWG